MKDDALYARHQLFDVGLLVTCLLLALVLLGVWQSGHWQSGFMPAQTISRYLPAVFWESMTTLGDARVQLALLLPFCLRYPRV